MSEPVIVLSAWDLGFAALLVLLLAVLSMLLRLRLSARLVIAAVRTAVQLVLLGMVLEYLFRYRDGWLVLLVSLLMLAVAGYEVWARQHRPFRGWWGYGVGALSMFVSAFVVTFYVLRVVIGPSPWYEVQYAIPLLGMILGNTMTGVALSLDRLTQSAWQQRAIIETRLALGQDWRHALSDIVRDSVRGGLTPIINGMAAAGVVSIPGMMTGQVLAGNAPFTAAKYQIMIMFTITAATGYATVLACWAGARRLFDERQRLRLERLRPPG
ncbi:MAG: iron export ABC transporter permease subunit FetB [Gammaproteobacteria bacterium]|nr:iron export ABC transporter permease subunit FetB [Gammaproteobacteria bacterium]